MESLGNSKTTEIWATHQEILLSLVWVMTYASGVSKVPQVIQYSAIGENYCPMAKTQALESGDQGSGLILSVILLGQIISPL